MSKIDYGKYPMRICRTMHECAECPNTILAGQEYLDGGYGRRVHLNCADSQHPLSLTPEQRLAEIALIIEGVDIRCMAADGPVTPTLQEMTQVEISRIYELATTAALAGS